MTVVTEALFNQQDETEELGSEQIIAQDFTNLDELNDRSDKAVNTSFDGYYHLGRGFLSVKMGRIKMGFKDLMTAVNSQTLNDRYRARAMYMLGSLYLNSSRAPLYGFPSCLNGKNKPMGSVQDKPDKVNTTKVEDDVQEV